MGSEALVVPLIGLAGTAIGVIAMMVISRGQTVRKPSRSKEIEIERAENILVRGQAVDCRELRILRALFGESKGRYLSSFKDKYYRPSLDATLNKGWVKQNGKKYFITAKGGEFCQSYLGQLLEDRKPANQV